MKSITLIFAFLMLFGAKGLAQENINTYKYIIVPQAFGFLNEPDQYQLNSLTKFLFEKYGFETFMQNEKFPDDLQSNRCLALMADVDKQKALFNTKLQINLRDCNNNIVFSSIEGQSREKMYDKAYNLALRDAFKSIEALNYTYQPSSKITTQETGKTSEIVQDVSTQNEIERLQKEVVALKEQQVEKQKMSAAQKEVAVKVKGEAKEEVKKVLKQDTKSDEVMETLFANPVENGYTISDASSKILYHLVFSGKEDVYIVKGQDAIVYKLNTTWIVANAGDNGLSMKTLNVKFN